MITDDPNLIERFFGTPGMLCDPETKTDRILCIDYQGAVLKYSITVLLDKDTVLVSGDIQAPFGPDSMYEVSVPCSSIREGPDGYHEGYVCLSFFHGDPDQMRLRMTIMKTPTGDLKVWPEYPFPPGHPFATD